MSQGSPWRAAQLRGACGTPAREAAGAGQPQVCSPAGQADSGLSPTGWSSSPVRARRSPPTSEHAALRASPVPFQSPSPGACFSDAAGPPSGAGAPSFSFSTSSVLPFSPLLSGGGTPSATYDDQLGWPRDSRPGARTPGRRSASAASAASPPSWVPPPPPCLSAPAGGADGDEPRMWSLDDFELGPRIGAGTFGHVRIARERGSGALIALKVMKKHRISSQRIQRNVAREIEIQAHLRHPHVLRLFGFFWDTARIYMIVEHARDGDLFELLQKQPTHSFAETVASQHIAQVAGALDYCHRMHVIHRDVKPQNILLGRGGRLKLADFGWAVHTLPGATRKTLCGSPEYLAPEMVHATCGHSFGVDAWGLGVLTYELLSGRTPFAAALLKETYRRIMAAAPDLSAAAFPAGGISDGARDFLARLLQREQAQRLDLAEAVAHAWLAPHLKGAAPSGWLDGRAASAGA